MELACPVRCPVKWYKWEIIVAQTKIVAVAVKNLGYNLEIKTKGNTYWLGRKKTSG